MRSWFAYLAMRDQCYVREGGSNLTLGRVRYRDGLYFIGYGLSLRNSQLAMGVKLCYARSDAEMGFIVYGAGKEYHYAHIR